jgi:hypothetical protein
MRRVIARRWRASSVGVLALASVAVVSCNWEDVSCAGVGYYALQLDIRNAQGESIVLGTTATLHDGAYREQVTSVHNPNFIYAASGRGGPTYDILVTRPYYADTWVRGVKTKGGDCVSSGDIESVMRKVTVVLPLAPGAPPVRALHLFPPHLLLDRPPHVSTATFTPYLDAAPGASRTLRWRITGDTASVQLDPVTGVLQYRCLPRSGYLTITAIAEADTTVKATADVAVQGHPAAVGDPPCS